MRKYYSFKIMLLLWMTALFMSGNVFATTPPQADSIQTSLDEGVTYYYMDGAPDGFSGEEQANLFDGTSSTKWCCRFTNREKGTSSNGGYIIFKTSRPIAPSYYVLTTANDTYSSPGRNWMQWQIYGMNADDSENVTRNSEGWVLLDDKSNVPVGNGINELSTDNYTSSVFTLSEENATQYRYFKIEIDKIVSNGTMQMSEFALGDEYTKNAEHIAFADANVKSICIANWDSNNDGELSMGEAASVTSLGKVFQGTTIGQFKELQFFVGLTSIEEQAFEDCKELRLITIPDSVKSIESKAFNGCHNVVSINLPNELETIGEQAFFDCKKLTSIAIPEGVTTIGASAFSGCEALKLLTIPESLTSVGENAFSDCPNLNFYIVGVKDPSSLDARCLPNRENGVLYVPTGYKEAFSAADFWNEFKEILDGSPYITFEDANVKAICVSKWDTDRDNELSIFEAMAVTSLGGVFNGKSDIRSFDELQYFTGITSIDNSSFSSCGNLSSIIIPNGVTNIGEYAFYSCANLSSITIPSGVTKIGYYAFNNCTNLKDVYCLTNAIPTISNNAFPSNSTIYVNSNLYDSFTNAEGWSEYNLVEFEEGRCMKPIFSYNEYKLSIKSLTEDATIYYTTDDTDPTTGSILYSEPITFDKNGIVKAIAVKEGMSDSPVAVFEKKDFIVDYPEITMSDDLVVTITTNVPDGKIYYVVSSQHITGWWSGGSNGATCTYDTEDFLQREDCQEYTGPFTLSKPCFVFACVAKEGWNNLNSLRQIQTDSKYNLSTPTFSWDSESKLLSITADEGATVYYTLDGSEPTTSSLQYTEPISINRNIEVKAIAVMSGHFNSDIRTYQINDVDSKFYARDYGLYFRLIDNTTDKVVEVTSGDNYTGDITVPSTVENSGTTYTVTRIGNNAFSSKPITSVVLPNTIESIGQSAFSGCGQFTSINIPDGVKFIERDAFYNCRQLAQIEIPSSVVQIQDRAFSYCSAIKNIQLPESLMDIGTEAFRACSSLASITLPSALTYIPAWFIAETGLVSIEIPSTVKTIGNYAFRSCRQLTSVKIPEGVEKIEHHAFEYCTELASLVLPSTLTTIEYNTFYNCTNLPSVTLPENLSTIGSGVFGNCSSLTSVYCLAATPPAMPDGNAFNSVTLQATLFVNADVVDTYKNTNYWAEFANISSFESMPCAQPTFVLSNYELSLSSLTQGATIYYTTDGTDPTTSSALYTAPIPFMKNDTVRAVAVCEGYAISGISVFEKNDFKVSTPVATMDSITFVATITCETPDIQDFPQTTIYYSIKNYYWDSDDWKTYTEPLQLTRPCYIRTKAERDGWNKSDEYTYNFYDAYYLSQPSPTWDSESKLLSFTAEEGASIYYTLDGTDPSATNGTLYTEPIAIERNLIVKSIAIKAGKFNSDINTYQTTDVNSDFAYEGITYRLIANTLADEVELYNGKQCEGDVIIPEKVKTQDGKEYTVVSILNAAFQGCKGLTSIIIPNSVTSIGNYAFYICESLTSITIPNSVTNIGYSAFESCPRLKMVVSEISTPFNISAFSWNNNATLVVPKGSLDNYKSVEGWNFAFTFEEGSVFDREPIDEQGVRYTLKKAEGDSIYYSVTGHTDSLKTEIVIPTDIAGCPIKTIDYNAFGSCDNLTSITIPSSIISIDGWAFNNCSNLGNVKVVVSDYSEFCNNNIVRSLNYPIQILDKEGNEITEYIIPDGVTDIGEYAFRNCKGLTSITMSNSIKTIGARSFEGCSGLVSISFGEQLTRIEENAFYNCSSLSSVVIPDSVTSIGYYAFNNCKGLKSITIPNNITEIGNYAFGSCDSVKVVTSKLSTPFEVYAFNWWSNNAILVVPKGSRANYKDVSGWDFAFTFEDDETIYEREQTDEQGVKYTLRQAEDYSFSYSVTGHSEELSTDLIIPVDLGGCPVKSIEGWVFNNCKSLTSVTIFSSITSIGYNFNSCDNLKDVKVVVFDYSDFCNNNIVRSLNHSIQLVDNDGNEIKEYIIPEGVTTIGEYAFRNCSGLTSITMSSSVTTIGDYAFQNCKSLTSIIIPDSVATIGNNAFSECDSIKVVTSKILMPFDVNAFNWWSNNAILIVPYGARSNYLTVNGWNFAFTYEEGETILDKEQTDEQGLRYTLKQADDGSFYYSVTGHSEELCEEVVIPTDFDGCPVGAIDQGVFRGCSTKKCIIPGTVRTIGNSAFYDNYYLEEVEFNEGLQTIGYDAFGFNFMLKEIRIPSTVTSIEDRAFRTNQENRAKISCLAATPPTNLGLYTFQGRTGATLHVVATDVDMYKDAEIWKDFSEIRGDITYRDRCSSPVIAYDNDILTMSCITEGATIYYTIDGSNPDENAICYSSPITYSTNQIIRAIAIADRMEYSAIRNFYDKDQMEHVNDEQGLQYTLKQADDYSFSYSVTGHSEDLSEEIVFPTEINGCPVRGIDRGVFYNCQSISSITIPSSITSIGSDAFWNCRNLDDVKIVVMDYSEFCNNNVVRGFDKSIQLIDSIGDEISEYIIPDGVTSIGDYAFRNCSGLASITIPSSVTSIGGSAFANCSGLSSVRIPNSVTSLGNWSFSGCINLATIKLGKNVSSIGEYAFSGCSSLNSIALPDGLESINAGAFQSTSLTSVIIPGSVKTIGNEAFSSCGSLSSVSLGDGITSIGNYAFARCGLTSITIPNSVTSIGQSAFESNNNLTTAILGDGFTEIVAYTFRYCRALSSVNIPDGVTTIGEQALAYCDKLSSVKLPETLTSMGNDVFASCHNLRSIELPNSITVIPDNLFHSNNFLYIKLGNNVKSIGDNAFRTNDQPVVEIGTSTPPSIKENSFVGIEYLSDLTVIVPNEKAEEAYRKKAIWQEMTFSNQNNVYEVTVDVPGDLSWELLEESGMTPAKVVALKVNGTINAEDFTQMRVNMKSLLRLDLSDCDITEIPDDALNGKSQLQELTLPTKLLTIGRNAFNGCTYLTGELELPSTLTSIGDYAFVGTDYTSVKLPSTLKTIGDYAFYNLRIKQKLTLPARLNSVGASAFERTQITELVIPDGVTSIGDDAFAETPLQGHVTIPDGIKYLGGGAFRNTRISSVFLPNSITTLSYGLFQGCTNLNIVYIPDNFTGVSNYAFDGCGALTTLRLSANTTSLGEYAFQNTPLDYLKVPSNVRVLPHGVLKNCKNLESLTLSGNLTSVESEALIGCTSLRNLSVEAIEPPVIKDRSAIRGINTDLCLISIPTQSYRSYVLAEYWGQFVQMRNDIAVETAGNGEIAFESVNEEEEEEEVTSESREFGHRFAKRVSQLGSEEETMTLANNGSSIYIPKDGKVRFFIMPYKDEELLSATLDGEDITPYIENGVYTATADKKNAKLVVKFSGAITPGDVNNDGLIDVADLTGLTHFILEDADETLLFKAADLDESGIVEVNDYSALVNVILNEDVSNNVRARRSPEKQESFVDMSFNDEGELLINLTAENKWFTALQFDITLPDGVSLTEDGVNSVSTEHMCWFMQREDDSYRVICSSMTNTQLKEGVVLRLRLDTKRGLHGLVTMNNIVLADVKAKRHESAPVGISIDNQTGIEIAGNTNTSVSVSGRSMVLTSSCDQTIQIVSINGVTVAEVKLAQGEKTTIQLPTGIYLVDGKKIIIK